MTERLASSEVNQNRTPSELIIESLFREHQTPGEELKVLVGEKVMVMDLIKHPEGEDRLIGEVVSVDGRSVQIEPQVVHRYQYDGEIDIHIPPTNFDIKTVVNAQFISDDPDDMRDNYPTLGKVDYEDPSVKFAVYGKLPTRMMVHHTGSGDIVGFDLNDPGFDSFVLKTISEVGHIKNLADVARLTKLIHESIKYSPNPRNRSKEIRAALLNGGKIDADLFDPKGIGEIINSDQAVCVQIAAVEMAVLRLMGVDADLMGNLRHVYVKVPIVRENGEETQIIVDPTWNVLLEPDDIEAQLQARGMPTEHHLPSLEYKMRFEPDWARA